MGRLAVAYEPASSDQAWAETFADAMTPLMNVSRGIGVSVIEYATDLSSAGYAASAIPPGQDWPWATVPDAGLGMGGAEAFRGTYFPAAPVAILHEVPARLSDEAAAQMRAFRAAMGGVDSLGVVTHPAPGIVVTLYAVHHDDIHASRRERTVLTRLTLHMEAAFRLRRFPSSIVCELDAAGRLAGEDPPEGRLETLSRGANALEHAYGASRGSADALALWPALLAGRLTVVRRGTGAGTRYALSGKPTRRAGHPLAERGGGADPHPRRARPDQQARGLWPRHLARRGFAPPRVHRGQGGSDVSIRFGPRGEHLDARSAVGGARRRPDHRRA